MNLKIKLILVTLLLGHFTFAQKTYNYSGVVKDKNTNVPLADALVIVKPLRTKGGGYYSGVKTKDDGRFDLTNSYSLPLNVIVTRKGCTSNNIKVKKVNDSFEIFLECEAETIEIIIEENKDFDNDGVINKNDECPDVKGPPENKGCPYPDSDQDGVPDASDNCPDVAGSAEFEGCPDPKNTITALLNENSFVFFELDRTALSKDATDFLDQIANHLNQSSGVVVEIIGHASSEGSSNYNQGLSERRAQSVADYLMDKGVNKMQLKTSGKGETQALEFTV